MCVIRGIPSSRWSFPCLLSAACAGLILENSRSAGHHSGASSVPLLSPVSDGVPGGGTDWCPQVQSSGLGLYLSVILLYSIFRSSQASIFTTMSAASFQLRCRHPGGVPPPPPLLLGVIRELCSLQIELSGLQPAIPRRRDRQNDSQNGVCGRTSG